MTNKIFGLWNTTALCAVSVALSSAAFAQSAVAPTASAAATAEADNGGLTDIVVTAQRRTQNLQEVPLSIVAIDSSIITRDGIRTIEQMNRMVPNMVIEKVSIFPGAASLSVRGVGYAGIESFADPEVAVYVNGIYQARNATALSQTLDLSSVEILRGPQGTLFGRNAFAGAIAISTARPDMKEASGKATATLGNFGLVDLDFIGNLPLVDDKVAARIAVRSHNLSGYFKNNGIVDGIGTVDSTLLGQRIGHEKSLIVRPSIRFTPTDNLDINLSYEMLRERDQAAPVLNYLITTGSLNPLGFTGKNPFGDESRGIPGDGSDPYSVGFSLGDKPMNFDQNSVTLDASYKTGIGTVRALLNYNDTKSEIWTDTDGMNVNVFTSARYENYKATSGELQFVSDFSDKLDIVAGVLGFHDEYKTTQYTYSKFTLPFPTSFSPLLVDPSYVNNGGKRDAFAAYAQGEFHITQALSLVAGGRYATERKHDYYGSNTLLSVAGLPKSNDPAAHTLPINTAVLFTAQPLTSKNFAPRVGVNFKASEDILLFGFWQRAFKSGGFNANSADRTAFNSPYGNEKVDNFEGGIKSEWFDHKLRFNLNAFYAKYSDLQRSLVTPSPTAPSGVTTVTTNAAGLESYGVEIELLARPMDQLTLFTNLGWNHAEYKSYCADLDGAELTTTPANGRAVCGPITTVPVTPTRYLVPTDFSNLVPVRAPRWDVTAGATKDVTIGSGVMSLTGSINYRSSMFVNVLNIPFSYRPAMTVFDGSIKWEPESKRYSLIVWGRNLSNQIQILNYSSVGPFAFSAATPPRTFGATMSMNF